MKPVPAKLFIPIACGSTATRRVSVAFAEEVQEAQEARGGSGEWPGGAVSPGPEDRIIEDSVLRPGTPL